jgi:hypothetical protein
LGKPDAVYAEMLVLLESLAAGKSVYLPPFRKLARDVGEQLLISEDNVTALQALEPSCKAVSAAAIKVPPPLFPSPSPG